MADATDRGEGTQPRRFRAYPEYKASGVEWLGQIPAHWGVERLKYLATLNDEALPESTDPSFEMTYVDIGSVDAVAGITETEAIVFEKAPSRARRVVRDGDIIVSTVRTYLRAIAAIHAPESGLVVSTGFAVLRPRHLESSFASYALRAPQFVERVVANSVGVSYPAINASSLLCFPIPYPAVDEQRAIADFLDRETAKIDALVARKERLIELLQERRTALITRAVTRGLDPNVPMKDSGVEWLGKIPAHWEVVPFGRLIRRIEQGWSPVAEDRPIGRDEWGVIKLSAVSRGVFRQDEHKALPLGLRPYTPDLVGDVCVVGVVRSQLMLCDLVYRLSLSCTAGDRDFLAYWFLSPIGRHQIEVEARGASQSMVKISQGIIRTWAVAVPSLGEQRAIVTFLNRETARIDALIANIQEAIACLTEFRTAVVSAAVTGKIDVRGDTPISPGFTHERGSSTLAARLTPC